MLTPEAIAASKDSITTLVVGANRGIGYELARQAKERGQKVIATTRTPSEELNGLGVRVVEGVDVTKDDDVRHLDDSLEGVHLDRLIINAGVLKRSSLTEPDFDAVLRQFQVNSMGPLRVAAAIHHRLRDGGKLAILTSRMGSIADNGSGGSYGYRMSKAAVNAVGMSLARDLADRSIAVALLHPGYVKTDMTGNTGHVTPDEAAGMLLDRVDDLAMEKTGVFWHANGEELPW
ncbi:MAG: short-chain dehydrogenase [Sandaracinus sp.]|nr:short-chain dehydrogenase [Sandaracinus sp.]|tara:strand:- start:1253 stop:1951 length:699 start_codon:yes stop_codon:yes gene_type:complete